MIPRRLGRVAITSSIGGLRPTCLGLLAGGVVDKRLWVLRKRCFFSYRVLVGVPAGDGMLKDRQLVAVAAGSGMLKDRLLVAVAAGGGVLTDGKRKHIAADAKAWHLAGERWVGEAHVRKRLGAPGGAFREERARARQERSAFDATA